MKNNSTIAITHHYKPFEYHLTSVGSTWFADSISLFIMPFICMSGIFTNITGFITLLLNSKLRLKMHYYLRVYFLNSFFICLFGLMYGVFSARRYLSFGNTWYAMVYVNQVAIPVVNTCYFYNNMLDLMMVFEKLCIFVRKFAYFNKKYIKKPLTPCVILFSICLIINLPIFFAYTPVVEEVFLDQNKSVQLYSYDLTQFEKSTFGLFLMYLGNFFRDILTFIILVCLNCILIWHLREYYEKKNKMISISGKNIEGLTLSNFLKSIISSQSVKNKQLKKQIALAHRNPEIKSIIMVLVICGMTFAKSILVIGIVIMPNIQIDEISNIICNFGNYSIFLSSALNFLLFITSIGILKTLLIDFARE